MSDDAKERARTALEDAVYRCLEAGMSANDIKDEVDYTLESAADE
jgi:hypothetical protein